MTAARSMVSLRKDWMLVIAIVAWFGVTAWLRHFTAPDEGRYAGVALEMLRSGDWVVPRLDGLPFFHKPPLFYWLSAAGMAIFGTNEWAARLPSILSATAAAGGLFLFLRRWSDRLTAVIALVALATMPYFFVAAQFANLDMLVAGCITGTILFAVHAVFARAANEAWRGALLAAFVSAALGVLAKGLIGIVLPGAIFLLWCFAIQRRQSVWLLAWWPGWIAFTLVAAPWFIAMQLRYPGFYDYFVVTQHFRRFAASGFNNANPFWFYVPVIVSLTLPWIAWVVADLAHRSKNAARRWVRPVSAIDWLMTIWFLVIVVFFSVPRSKLIGYVLPALPPLAWFVSRSIRALLSDPLGRNPWLRATLAGAAGICVAAVVAADHFGTPPGARLQLPATQRVQTTDQILMLDVYLYELPFYWRFRQPMHVLADWRPSSLAVQDSWRNELFDAGRFEPDLGKRLLIDDAAVRKLLCQPVPTWIVGSSSAQAAYRWLADPQFVLVAYNDRLAVWRFAGTANLSGSCQTLKIALPNGAKNSP